MKINLRNSAISTGFLLCSTSEELNQDTSAGAAATRGGGASLPALDWRWSWWRCGGGHLPATDWRWTGSQSEGYLWEKESPDRHSRKVFIETRAGWKDTAHSIKFTVNISSPLKDKKIQTRSLSSNNTWSRRLVLL